MRLATELYVEQLRRWPAQGRHILASYDGDTIIVYQAYNPNVAAFTLQHGRFGEPHFSFARMSWIKPNFLWMMYRCGWATKENQERVLALRIDTRFFDTLLEQAVPSSLDADLYASHDAWKAALETSEVRLQWDPDHDPGAAKQERRAIQIGLRGEMLRAFATTELREVIDMTPFVHEQARLVAQGRLAMPSERPYGPRSAAACRQIGLVGGAYSGLSK